MQTLEAELKQFNEFIHTKLQNNKELTEWWGKSQIQIRQSNKENILNRQKVHEKTKQNHWENTGGFDIDTKGTKTK